MTESQAKQDLRAVRALLSSPDKWTKGAFARDKDGWNCVTSDPDAREWCIAGAVIKVCQETVREEACFDALDLQLSKFLHESIIVFNDSSSFDEVSRVIDAAIEATP